ncbi:hypothetical protein SKAU_G00340810 [Synaphobranchus kaupii]|uniref:Uncharacterized protein n=1 Tax=Synaphobranchus kaupii TaxID=118154 RepID=A0A9Q1IIH8_SYNKA|nr:hypothetical protein SKAU_G00340810 [Synaphobranchus kaupii]
MQRFVRAYDSKRRVGNSPLLSSRLWKVFPTWKEDFFLGHPQPELVYRFQRENFRRGGFNFHPLIYHIFQDSFMFY